MREIQSLSDREMVEDLLAAQSLLTRGYNAAADACAGDGLTGEMAFLLGEEHQIRHELFLEMEKRGWRRPRPAPEEGVRQARERFRQAST